MYVPRPFCKRIMVRQSRGFTLIEVMIVCAIIALLAAIAIPCLNGFRNISKRKSCYANIEMLNRATEAYIINENLANNAEVTVAMLAPETSEGMKSNYFIHNKPKCPADGEYQYSSDTQRWHCSVCGAGD